MTNKISKMQTLKSSLELDRAILNEKHRLIVIRFGDENDVETLYMDEVINKSIESLNNIAVFYKMDLKTAEEVVSIYELIDPCSLMFFFRNKHIMVDLGTGNYNKINWLFNSKQDCIDIIETIYRGVIKGKTLIFFNHNYSSKYKY